MDDIICLASDSDFESSPPKNPRTTINEGRKKTNRGRTKLVKQSSPQKESNSSVGPNQDNSTTNSNTNNQTQMTVPVAAQPRKTARRGLARKDASDPNPDASSEVPKISTNYRKVSVYSECVSRTYQSIYAGTGGHLAQDSQSKDTAPEEDSHQTTKDSKGETREASADCASTSCGESGSSEEATNDEAQDEISAAAPIFLRSPTPPPEVQNYAKAHRVSRRLTKALKTLNTAKAQLNSNGSTPSRRGSNRATSISPAVVFVSESPAVRSDMIIKVRYLSTVHRLRHNMTQPFHLLLTKLSQELGKEEHLLSLFLRESSLSLSSTPKGVNLSVADIIECYNMTDVASDVLGGESINVVIQCANGRKKISMMAYKRLPLQDLMEKYAEKVGLDMSSFGFQFDGEDVSPKDTLLKLDMEEGDVLDVVPTTDKDGKRLPRLERPQVITLN